MTSSRIFVFGSNLAGRHGAGSAKEALKSWGAVYGVGVGHVGNSYAIPTKGFRFEVLPLETIRGYVKDFLIYADQHPELIFQVVAIGCGLAGYKPHEIAPMFQGASSNVELPGEFKECLPSTG